MKSRLSFYYHQDSPLHRLNPLTKLVAAFTLIILAFWGPWYWLATCLFGLVVILSFVAKVNRQFLKMSFRLLLPVCGFLFVMQSFFHPGGENVIFKLGFLTLTTESIQFAYQTVSRILVMVEAFILLLLTTRTNILMSDLTRRGLSGNFAYVITSTLQIIPQMQAKASTITDAQRSRGMETEGSFKQRIKALVPLVGPLVFGSLVEVEERAIAIEARGFNSPLTKTSLVEIRDLQSEKVFRWLCLLSIVAALGSRIWLS
jgi:energy-coupling factor transport system permease protein